MTRIEPTFSTPNAISFVIEKVNGVYRVLLDNGSLTTFIENVRCFSTIGQMILEGLRRVAGSNASMALTVVDPTGEWSHWINHNRAGVWSPKDKVPSHKVA